MPLDSRKKTTGPMSIAPAWTEHGLRWLLGLVNGQQRCRMNYVPIRGSYGE